MEVDYIIVGNGLAGISFCEQLMANHKTFMVFDNNSQQSSTVAGGLYNPVVLKRFTPVWRSDEQLQIALPMYLGLERKLGVKLDHKIHVKRKFTSVEEQNDWFTASDKPILSNYLSPKITKNNNDAVIASFGFGEVLQTGRIDVKCLMDNYRDSLLKNNRFMEEAFDYSFLEIDKDGFEYKNIKAKYIVFAEGFGVKLNPYFKDLPLVPTKGELLTIHAPDLKIDYVLKGPVFLIPMENDLYRVGATYEWGDTANKVTVKAKNELVRKLKTLIDCPFEITGQVVGIRPTVKDRRPLVGQHPVFKNMFVLNGLGTRGVMIGPYIAKHLFDFIEKGVPLDKEIDIKRFN
jgi:hypothetical protein